MKNLSELMVCYSDGAIAVEATCLAFRNALLAHIAEQEKQDDEISRALNGIFDTYKGARINMPALVALALQRLGADPTNYKTLEEAVYKHIRHNLQVFRVAKGKNGGVSRIADQP
jgi:hypothetical protein